MFFGTFIQAPTTKIIGMFLPSYYATDAIGKIYDGVSILSTEVLIDFAFISIVSVIIVLLGIYLFKKVGNK